MFRGVKLRNPKKLDIVDERNPAPIDIRIKLR